MFTCYYLQVPSIKMCFMQMKRTSYIEIVSLFSKALSRSFLIHLQFEIENTGSNIDLLIENVFTINLINTVNILTQFFLGLVGIWPLVSYSTRWLSWIEA